MNVNNLLVQGIFNNARRRMAPLQTTTEKWNVLLDAGGEFQELGISSAPPDLGTDIMARVDTPERVLNWLEAWALNETR